jgi:hypothetical protein
MSTQIEEEENKIRKISINKTRNVESIGRSTVLKEAK